MPCRSCGGPCDGPCGGPCDVDAGDAFCTGGVGGGGALKLAVDGGGCANSIIFVVGAFVSQFPPKDKYKLLEMCSGVLKLLLSTNVPRFKIVPTTTICCLLI